MNALITTPTADTTSPQGGVAPIAAAQDQNGLFDANPKGRQAAGRFVPTATPEQRAAGLAKGRESRAANRAALRSDFPDDGYWTELAAAEGIKLPPYGVPCSPGRMARWLAILGIPVDAFLYWFNGPNLRDWINLNPKWPLKAFVGITLEHRDLIMRQWEAREAAR